MSGRHRDEDLAYGSYPAQDESQGGEEGERGFVGDTLNSLLGRRPQGQQSVCEISDSSIANLLIRDHRTSLRPTNHSCMANSSSSRTADHPPVTANPHRVSNGRLALHLAGPFFSINSRVLYMTSVQNSRASCQAHQKSIATLTRVGIVDLAITMGIWSIDF